MVNVGIVGATGHTAEELINVLLKHPNIRIAQLYNSGAQTQVISDVFPRFRGRIDLVCKKPDVEEIAKTCDAVFLALPHTVSMDIVAKILNTGRRVIDFSADYRLKDAAVYEKFYKVKHKDKSHLKEAVYGLPEIYRENIRTAKLVANPGCYPTCAILGLAPLISFDLIEPDSIIIDAKSGITGAGKKLVKEFLFSEINEDFRAYKINEHQHIPEINQELAKLCGKKINVTFVPHLLPLNRGILETIYVKKNRKASAKSQKLIELYKRFYKKEPFIRISNEGEFPCVKDVAGTNFCDIGIKEQDESAIIIAAIDNLLKGASGQAVQNMNIIYGFPEHMGL